MKLYMVQFDGDHDYVEAVSFADAIKAWQAYMVETQDLDDWDAATEPEGVTLVSEKAVIRKA